MSYYYEGNGNFSTDEQRTQNKTKPQSEEKRNPQPQKKDSDIAGWLFIAFMFTVAWPIGLFLLISKLSENDGSKKASTAKSKSSGKVKKAADRVTRSPRDTNGTARVLKIVGIALAAVGALACLGTLSDLSYALEYGYIWQLVEDLFVAAGFLAGGGALLVGSGAMKRRMRRYGKYLAVAGTSQSVSLSRLAAAAEVSERRVERDLELMIEKGLWGEGAYVDLSAGKLFRSAMAGAAHYEAKAAPVTPPEAQQGYSGMLRQIRRANDRIADEALSMKIDRVIILSGWLGLAGALCLMYLAWCRYAKIRPQFWARSVVLLYLMLHMLCRYRVWSAEPELLRFIFDLAATVCFLLSSYQRLTIEVGMAQRRGYLCLNMLGVFFAMTALPGSSDRLFLCCMAVWAMSDLCSLRTRMPRKQEDA